MDPTERSMQMRFAAHKSWAATRDRSARTAAARKASHHTRFVEMARTQNPGASETEIAQIAESLRKAHYTELALKSVQARRARSEAAKSSRRSRTQAELAQYEAGTGDAA